MSKVRLTEDMINEEVLVVTKRERAVIAESTLGLILNQQQNSHQPINHVNACVSACVRERESYMLQGTPPTVMVRSEGRPVSRFRPVIVRTVPPAFGPLSGDTVITNGS